MAVHVNWLSCVGGLTHLSTAITANYLLLLAASMALVAGNKLKCVQLNDSCTCIYGPCSHTLQHVPACMQHSEATLMLCHCSAVLSSLPQSTESTCLKTACAWHTDTLRCMKGSIWRDWSYASDQPRYCASWLALQQRPGPSYSSMLYLTKCICNVPHRALNQLLCNQPLQQSLGLLMTKAAAPLQWVCTPMLCDGCQPCSLSYQSGTRVPVALPARHLASSARNKYMNQASPTYCYRRRHHTRNRQSGCQRGAVHSGCSCWTAAALLS